MFTVMSSRRNIPTFFTCPTDGIFHSGKYNHCYVIVILLDFSLTVKAATLIFISGRGSPILSAKEGKSGFIYNLVNLISFLSRANVRAFHETPNRIHTELTPINP